MNRIIRFERYDWSTCSRFNIIPINAALQFDWPLLHNGKVPVNAELRPLRREKLGMEVQRYATLNEAMKIWRDNLQFLHRTATHIFPQPFIHTCPFIAQERLDLTILKEHHVTVEESSWFEYTCLLFYHTSYMDIAISMYLLKVMFVQQHRNKPVP